VLPAAFGWLLLLFPCPRPKTRAAINAATKAATTAAQTSHGRFGRASPSFRSPASMLLLLLLLLPAADSGKQAR
jgi:hypothetical protein